MPLSGCRILVVEDEALIALDLEHTLRELHAVVIGPVDNIADARRFIAAGRIDCAVLDVQLGADSIKVLIPELDARDIPRVFMTAFSQTDLPTTWKAWPVILKPMATGDLLRAIEQVLVSRAREP